jgi:Domain of unknown function (DUF4232)
MPDLEGRVRDLLERRAADVGPRLDVPPTLVRRARWRSLTYAVVTCAVVVAVAVGATVALRSMPEAPVDRPGDTGANAPSACAADQLTATAVVEGAAGSRDGTITLTNASGTICKLAGRPSFSLVGQDGNPITSGIRFMPMEVPPSEITLRPGQSAAVTYGWSNWCEGPPPSWRMEAPGSGQVPVAGLGPDAPPCNGPGEPSIVEYGAYEVPAAP